MKTLKVLWLSRHSLSETQQLSLLAKIRGNFDRLEVINMNVTFHAKGSEAATVIRNLAAQHDVTYIAGVFPAHIACALMTDCLQMSSWEDSYCPSGLKLCLPVSVPKQAQDGEVRGFEHSHWEIVSV